MKPDYKNWVPKSMLKVLVAGTIAAFSLFMLFGVTELFLHGTARIICAFVFGIGTVVLLFFSAWMFALHRVFDYNGKRRLAKTIVDGSSAYVDIPEGGIGLDVGCGSGALTIACAKRNPKAKMIGIDRWGREYASFSKALCESNAAAEGVRNVSFALGNALKLDFEDETFDAVTSNYVYHNIPSNDRQAILLETLRILKKGGTFAIHDLFSKARYGDMQSFIGQLKDRGYEEAELIDTANGMFIGKTESRWLGLSGSALLIGKK